MEGFMKLISTLLATVAAFSLMADCPCKAKNRTAQTTQQTAIQQALSQLQQYSDIQKSLNIQNPDIAYAMRKALTMADLLVKTDGTLDISSCAAIKSAFISSHPEEYEVNMRKVLDQLNSSNWQTFFANIQAPSDTNVGNFALRALFSMDPITPMTDRHAKVAVLAAVLAPYNQGSVGDCFAVNDVIRDHEEYFRSAAQDYRSIVMNGYIERPVDTVTDFFFFLPILADDDRDQPFTLTISGRFPNTRYFLFDAPGFAAARSIMGGNNIVNLTAIVMKSLSSGADSAQIQTTPSQVILAMAQAIAAQTSNTNVADLCAKGEYAFSSLTNNPVLRGVEAAFAAMAEDRPKDSIRSAVNACVAEALQPVWQNLQSITSIDQFQSAYNNALNASYQLIYNLDIPLAQVSADGSSTSGGFQMYQRNVQSPAQLGTRVATPEDFRQLVLNAVTAAMSQLGTTSDIQTIGNSLIQTVNTDDFLKNALRAYDPRNQNEPDPIQNYQKLDQTPMQSCVGDN